MSSPTAGAHGKKVVVLGLDGVPYSLLDHYMKQGIMPELSKLCQGGGQLVRMDSSLPEVSSVAWTGFMTGRNPGQHGIFGFMELDRESYKFSFPNFRSLKVRPFWERHNIRTVALNIPQTYPAIPMNGAMVSGFVALDLKKATYPETLYRYLNGISYRLDVKAGLAATNPEAFFQDLFATFQKRREATEHLFEDEEWQLFITVITETDRLHHFFFNSAKEGEHFQIFEKFYRELDTFVGAMARRAAEVDAAFLTCSDHGFAPITREVNLNRWLVEHGYLSVGAGEGLTGIQPETRAFCLDPSRLYVHSKGKYKRGSVASSDYEDLCKELQEKLEKITCNGRKVVNSIYRKGDIFQGPFKDAGPDLYVLPNYGFDLKASMNSTRVFDISAFTGMHTFDDAHLFMSEGLPPGDPKIQDVEGIVLNLLKAKALSSATR